MCTQDHALDWIIFAIWCNLCAVDEKKQNDTLVVHWPSYHHVLFKQQRKYGLLPSAWLCLTYVLKTYMLHAASPNNVWQTCKCSQSGQHVEWAHSEIKLNGSNLTTTVKSTQSDKHVKWAQSTSKRFNGPNLKKKRLNGPTVKECHMWPIWQKKQKIRARKENVRKINVNIIFMF